MSQTCPVTITWERGPSSSVELVAVGEWIGEPLSASGRQDVLDVPGMGVVEAYFRALGGALLDVSFTLEADEATLADALEKHLDLQGNWMGLDGKTGTLTIEPEDASWQQVFTPCILADLTPALPGDTGAATVRRTLRFVSAPPTYTEPEPEP